MQYRSPGAFPRGTWLINVTGSFVLGLLVGLGARHALPDRVVVIAGVGFCGAYTTFSTFSYELVHLREERQVGKSLLYGASSLAAGLSAAAAGLAIGSF
ncbi:CrcB family protein [Streptomyces sp. NPDC005727]|uniref:FluC/FEX family fluoride channel n=1 Tax=Streptomyces sp. NPDC005727 TaxID=3157053 RepID=UPI0034023B31